jgi:hypothetical protein
VEPPTLEQLREIAEAAQAGPDGLFRALATPRLVLHLLDLIEGKTRNLP